MITSLLAQLLLSPAEGERITLDDVEAKFRELQGGASDVVARAQPKITAAAIVGGTLTVLLVYLFGRRKGRKRATVLEIRRIV
ncbi:MAG TPA: hypothetical protein VGS21_06070 [Acidimicrobiales bacterium]|nr:hypothetical protein [Acidimicrobiales bacterium]